MVRSSTGKEERATPTSPPAAAAAAASASAGANKANNLALAAHILQQAQQQSASGAIASNTSPQTTTPAAPATQAPTARAASAAETLHTLASIMNSSAAAAAANKHLLPSSAPVSSLLPPIPAIGNAAAAAGSAAARASSAPASAAPSAQPAAISSQLAALLAPHAQSATPPPSAAAAHFAASQNPLLRHPSNAAQVAAAAAAASAVPSTLAVPNMQNWSLEQLQQHVQLLEQLKQPIPQTVSLLLADAKRKEEKRNAKRIANRKSASTSRARKKAYVQEMTELNARLKRQALILSLLPDMVIVIQLDGNISFCSAQVERVLRYEAEELVGVNLTNLLVPASKEKLNRLIKQLTGSNDKKRDDGARKGGQGRTSSDPNDSNLTPGSASSGAENSGTDGAVAVSEPSFPLSVVQVEAKREKASKKKKKESDTSDTSTSNNGKQPSSLTASNDSRSNPMFASDNDKKDSNVEEGSGGEQKSGGGGLKSGGQFPSSDVSNSSSLSTNAKNVQQANTNLERNVRIHNKKLKTESGGGSLYKDDVTGADVTANNASARLSSLQHRPESSSSEEDSGYRESNDSREETSSSVSDSSGSNGRRRPIAPTCNVCLIRKDLTTIWCEVTSSIRTKEPDEDSTESISGNDSNRKLRTPTGGSKTPPPSSSEQGLEGDTKTKENEVQKELLLCLRPVRDGDGKIHEKLRFESKKRGKKKKRTAPDAAWAAGQAPGSPSALAEAAAPSRPFKKRGLAEVSKEATATRNSRVGGSEDQTNSAVDTDAAESLMLMTGKKASP